jgi:hypothetical protein
MAEAEDSPELQVARLFRLAGHEVTQAVGEEPGTVDWFATPREGFVRPRTYWQAWRTCPERLDEALEALERARVAKHADRALGVVIEGGLTEGYAADLERKTANVLTFRRCVLEVSGIADSVRRVARLSGAGLRHGYVPRRARLDSGAEIQVEPYVDAWLEQVARPTLVIDGPARSGKSTVITAARIRSAHRFVEDPDNTRPLVHPVAGDAPPLGSTYWLARDVGAIVAVTIRGSSASDIAGGPGSLEEGGDDTRLSEPGAEVVRMALLPPSVSDVVRWVEARIPSPERVAVLAEALARSADFAALCTEVNNLGPLLQAIEAQPTERIPRSVGPWIASVVTRFADTISVVGAAESTLFEEAALAEFGLGRALLQEPVNRLLLLRARSFFDPEARRFRNTLMRDHFLARKVLREHRAGHVEILLRYQLPPNVLLFLAILAPDVAAQATSERGEAMRAQIETEVERRLQLTLAHALKRSAGAVRSHLKAIQRHVERTTPGVLQHEFARIDEEAAFQCALAEQTRLWHEVPESEIVGLALASTLDAVVADLREGFPSIAFESAIDPALQVRATQ